MIGKFTLGCAFACAAVTAQAQTQITVYSAGPASLINQLAKGFTAVSGVKVNVFQGTTGQVMARLESEAANPKADVLISASWDTATGLAAKGWLAPYRSPAEDEVPASLKTEYAVAEGVSALGIAWNPQSGTPRPRDWSDLAKPDFKDKVTIPDPAQSGASFELVAALEARAGDWSLFDALKKNGAVVSGANAQALTSVLQGAKAAVFGAVDYISFAEKAKGESIEMIFPASGTVIAPRPIMVMKSSKQQASSKQFLDYVLSEKGQAMVAKAYLAPGRLDVNSQGASLKSLELLPLDESRAFADRKAILTGFAKALARS